MLNCSNYSELGSGFDVAPAATAPISKLVLFFLLLVAVLIPAHAMGQALAANEETHPDITTELWGVVHLEGGDAHAQYKFGIAYNRGDGVPQDLEAAAHWFRLAAEQGHPKAQYQLGIAYDEGYGVEIDTVKAGKWLLRSAEQGDVGGQNRMGIRFVFGHEIKKNVIEGVKWSLVSKRAGFLGAYIFLPYAWCVASSEEWDAGTTLADQWVPKLEDSRHPFN